MEKFNGLGMNMGNISRLSDAETRSISPENYNGGKGTGGMAETGSGAEFACDLGRWWKMNPCVEIKAGEVFTIADISGPGVIQQIWMTMAGTARFSILRIYWDGQEQPSVECPLGDFFCSGWGELSLIHISEPTRPY